MEPKEPNRIKEFREKSGLTQKTLAARVKTSQQQIQRIESGRQSARYDLALKICAVLKAPMKKVFPKTGKAVRILKKAASLVPEGSSRISRTPTSKALLADATDMEFWAKRLDANSRLPQLIRRLAFETLSSIERIQFRSGEGIRLEGWDGIVQAPAGNAFIPAGVSAWEIGTNADIKGKADEDYEKRTLDPLGLNPADTTFVFATPRRWKAKEKWAHAKRRDGKWRDVRVLDADDLATWLEQGSATHIWFSKLVGKQPPGVSDLESFWKTWSGTTRPSLKPELLVAGRGESVKEIKKFLESPPSALGLQAETREEATAFLVATVLQGMTADERDRIIARGIVVEDSASWRQLAAVDKSLILIPTFADRAAVAEASARGHFVVIPLGQGEPPIRGGIQLPRLRREEAKKALEAMGITESQAGDLSTLARRSVGALRRKLAINPSVLIPKWASPENARQLLPALLAGRWNDRNPSDQEALSRLAGLEYRQLQELLIRWANEQDPPVRRMGDTWTFSSREDGWSLLARYLNKSDLERLKTTVLDVLGERDPKYDLPVGERWGANFHGKVLKHSHLLRDGLAETLGIMGAYSEIYPVDDDTQTGQQWVDHIVNILFANADWHLWASLSPHLRSLAEAAPEAFMSALDRDLSSQDTKLVNLFSDTKNNLFESSPHTGLLWSLEILAWSPDYLGQVALLLAKLARLDPGGNLVNRPLHSLKEIFLCWYPGTSANLEQRLKVLDNIRRRKPAVAWDLLASILPGSMDIAHPTAKPNWREWITERDSATWAEVYKASEEISRRMLEDVGSDGSRWETLIESLQHLRKPEFESVVGRLQTLGLDTLGEADRTRIWNSLRQVISRNLQHQEAKWAMPLEAITRLQQTYARFEPADPIIKHLKLFSHHPDLPEAGYTDYEERDKAIDNLRVKAVDDLFGQGGLSMVLSLIDQVQSPFDVGRALGVSSVLDEQENSFLVQCLASTNLARRQAARSFIYGRVSVKGPGWLDALRSCRDWRSWSPKQKSDYFCCLPFSKKTWDTLESEEEETQRQYWMDVGITGHGKLESEVCERAVLKFMEYGYLGSAVDFLDLYTHHQQSRVRPQLVAEVLQKVINGANTEKVDWSSLAHDFGELLDYLEKSGEIEEAELAKLEWNLLPLLRHHERQPKILHKALSEDPAFFIEVMKLMYRAEGEESQEITEEQKLKAHLAYDLAHGWHLPPGVGTDGNVSSEKLRSWISKARELAVAGGRGKIVDHYIGKVLSYYPTGKDGAWPHEALRPLLEELGNEEIEEGICIGIFNSRGVINRSLGEGGVQERAIADKYNQYARLLNDEWPRTARLMKNIAKNYESDARREDIEAELREDLLD